MHYTQLRDGIANSAAVATRSSRRRSPLGYPVTWSLRGEGHVETDSQHSRKPPIVSTSCSSALLHLPRSHAAHAAGLVSRTGRVISPLKSKIARGSHCTLKALVLLLNNTYELKNWISCSRNLTFVFSQLLYNGGIQLCVTRNTLVVLRAVE